MVACPEAVAITSQAPQFEDGYIVVPDIPAHDTGVNMDLCDLSALEISRMLRRETPQPWRL